MLNKIKNIKVNPSILVIGILILILICSLVLFFVFSDYKKMKTEKHNFYYYFSSERVDFEGNIITNSDNTILSLNNDNITITSTPIYYLEQEKQMILPSNMEIVYPYKNKPMYKLGKLSKVYNKSNNIYVNTENGIGRLYDCFLYDGADLYVFVENTTVIIGENKYELSPLSFVEASQGYIKIYNMYKDEYIFLEDYTGIVEAYTKEYYINLSHDTFTYNTAYYMLIKNVDGLSYVDFKTN